MTEGMQTNPRLCDLPPLERIRKMAGFVEVNLQQSPSICHSAAQRLREELRTELGISDEVFSAMAMGSIEFGKTT